MVTLVLQPLRFNSCSFIFLFRWTEERRARRKVIETAAEIFVKDEEKVNSIFFAQQVGECNDFAGLSGCNVIHLFHFSATVPNSCATHALLSILLNCPDMHLGETLTRLKTHTKGMSPENKGLAIGNTPELACAHNSHAMTQAKRRLDKSSGISTGRFTGEAFHFVSFVPIDGHLFELDGLKPFPMNHGPWKEFDDWTDKFRITMEERLGISSGEQDIRFNLMAVVPDRRIAITQKLDTLKINVRIVTATLEKLVKAKQTAAAIPVAKSEPKAEEDVKSDLAGIKSEVCDEGNDNDAIQEETVSLTDERKADGLVKVEESPEINILHQLSLQNETLVCVWDGFLLIS